MTLLDCLGDVVGLPEEHMESSEVGKAINNSGFFSNAILYQAVDGAVIKNKAMRVLGIQPPMDMTGMSLRKLD
jgi:2,3-bisphosphoglycerate-independent phosphoglycerate mutase